MTNPEIARRQDVSVDAVKYHVANALQKLGLSNRGELRVWNGVRRDSALHRKASAMNNDITLGPIGQISRTVKDIAAARSWYADTLGLHHLYSFAISPSSIAVVCGCSCRKRGWCLGFDSLFSRRRYLRRAGRCFVAWNRVHPRAASHPRPCRRHRRVDGIFQGQRRARVGADVADCAAGLISAWKLIRRE
jgi:hypothetical protein